MSLETEETGRLITYRYGLNVFHYFNPEKVPELSPKVTPKPQPEKADDFDLFGDEEPEKKVVEAVKPVVKKKEKPAAKSIVVFDVKVYEQEQDLTALAKKVFEIAVDGLVWNKEVKILPVAYGMNKLQVGCVVEDEKVSTDDLFDQILAWEDEVQSVDIVTFQKL